MVEDVLLDNFRKVCDALEQSRGTIYLFAVIKMDELTNKWTVAISAAWVADTTFDEVFSELRTLLMDNLGDEMANVARISVYSLEDHFAQLMMHKYETGDSIKEDQQINGNLIHEGYIIKARRPEATGSSAADAN